MHSRDRDVVMMMRAFDEAMREVSRGVVVNINQRADARTTLCACFLAFLGKPTSRKVANDLGPVLVAMLANHRIDFFK